MKLSKAAFTVIDAKPHVEQQLEGEAKGRLAKVLKLHGNVAIAKVKGLFSDAGSYERKVQNHYDENGALLDADGGKFDVNCEGRACNVKTDYGLVDAEEFEDCTLDSIKMRLAEGRVVEVWARLRLHPTNKQLAKIDNWLKEEIKITLNGETIMIGDEDENQDELDLGGGEGSSAEVEESDEAAPSLAASLAEFDKAEVPQPNPKEKGKPSVHGEPVVDGQRPPQRPRPPKRSGGETVQ